jgi:hypothetical protein
MGLDFLNKKEEAAKEIYSDFSKSMLSNVYNSEQLKNEIQENIEKIDNLKNGNLELEKTLSDVIDRIGKGQEYRDNLLKSKFTDIDREISLLQPDKVNSEISSINLQKYNVVNQLKEIKVVEPTEFYHEDQHDKVKEEYQQSYKQKIEVETNISGIEKLKSSVSNGIKCEHCGIELMNASITQSRIAELDGLIMYKIQIEGLMTDLSVKEQGFVQLKKDFDEYEKNKLIKEKYELSIESFDLKIENLNNKLIKYQEIQDKISENIKIESQLIKAGMRLDELDIEKRGVENKISTNNFTIKNSEDKIDSNKKLIEKIKEESEKEKIYKIYLEIFGKNGVSKMIMKTMMPLINSELQRLLEDSSHFRLEIRINDKNEVEFIMIDNNTQVEKLMVSGSGYERTIASLALRAVLSKICSLPKPNIIVFDEVFGKISNDNLDMVSEFFTKIKEYFEKIFVITHNPLVTNWSDNIIRIKKIDNISFVTQ